MSRSMRPGARGTNGAPAAGPKTLTGEGAGGYTAPMISRPWLLVALGLLPLGARAHEVEKPSNVVPLFPNRIQAGRPPALSEQAVEPPVSAAAAADAAAAAFASGAVAAQAEASAPLSRPDAGSPDALAASAAAAGIGTLYPELAGQAVGDQVAALKRMAGGPRLVGAKNLSSKLRDELSPEGQGTLRFLEDRVSGGEPFAYHDDRGRLHVVTASRLDLGVDHRVWVELRENGMSRTVPLAELGPLGPAPDSGREVAWPRRPAPPEKIAHFAETHVERLKALRAAHADDRPLTVDAGFGDRATMKVRGFDFTHGQPFVAMQEDGQPALPMSVVGLRLDHEWISSTWPQGKSTRIGKYDRSQLGSWRALLERIEAFEGKPDLADLTLIDGRVLRARVLRVYIDYQDNIIVHARNADGDQFLFFEAFKKAVPARGKLRGAPALPQKPAAPVPARYKKEAALAKKYRAFYQAYREGRVVQWTETNGSVMHGVVERIVQDMTGDPIVVIRNPDNNEPFVSSLEALVTPASDMARFFKAMELDIPLEARPGHAPAQGRAAHELHLSRFMRARMPKDLVHALETSAREQRPVRIDDPSAPGTDPVIGIVRSVRYWVAAVETASGEIRIAELHPDHVTLLP